MAFPASVTQLPNTRKPTRKSRNAQDTSPDEQDVPWGVGIGGPVLDFGRPGAVRLSNERGRWRWIWASEERSDVKIQTGEEGVVLFPPTRQPIPSQEDLSLDDKLHAATEYLSDALEEYDRIGVQELIAAELTSTQSLPRLNSSHAKGRTLEIVINPRAKIARTIVCFPMGEIGSHLNTSPFLPWSTAQAEGQGVIRFNAMAQPAISYPTEILQLCSSPVVSSSRMDRDATAMIVRLGASTHLLNLIPDYTYMPPTDSSPVKTVTVGTLHPSNTAGLRHVDVALDPNTWSRALIVDECGGVWLWYEEKVERSEKLEKVMKLSQVRQAVTTEREGFFRIAFGTRPGTAIVMSRRELVLLDLYTSSPPITLLTLTGKGREFVSLEKTAAEREAGYIVACTTFEVLWIDEFTVGSPGMSWIHDYGDGKKQDLELNMIRRGGDDCLLLSSPTDPLVMVFTVPSSPPIQSHHTPYLLRMPSLSAGGALISLATIKLRRYSTDQQSPTLLLGLSSVDGSLWSISLRPASADQLQPELRPTRSRNRLNAGGAQRKRNNAVRVQWYDDVRQIAEKGWDESGDTEGLGGEDRETTKYEEYNMRWAWLEINNADVYHDGPEFTIADFEQYLKENDTPFDHLMTAGGIARDATYGESSRYRSNLLLPFPQVERDLSFDIGKWDLSRYLPYTSQIATTTTNHAFSEVFPALKFVQIYADARTRHRNDVMRLATDLALSRRMVFSEDLSSTSNKQSQEGRSPEDLFAQATGALSLNENHSPPIRFSFLTPRMENTQGSPTRPSTPTTQTLKGDVFTDETSRSILDEWVLGTDPALYEWKPWKGERDPTTNINTHIRPIRPLPSPRPASIRTFGATQPLLRATNSVPTLMALPPAVARSSPPPALEPASSGDLGMDLFTLTQVEPGRFGGRAGGGKKKVKKRVGGF